MVTVRPAEAPLYGNVLVVPETIEPNPPQASADILFPHTITSAASQEATFSISVSLGGAGEALSDTKYDHLVTVLNKDKQSLPNRAIKKLAPNVKELIYVKVRQLPFTAAFSILVAASAPGVKGGDSGVKTYTVGTEDPNDDLLTLETPTYTPTTAVSGGVVSLKSGSTVKANMTLKLSEKAIAAGMTSCNCDFELRLANGSGWTLLMLDPTADQGTTTKASNVSLTKDAPRIVEFAIQAKPNPSLEGSMTLTVIRRGQAGGSTKSKTFSLTLKVVAQ
jgi:hypothetical protein